MVYAQSKMSAWSPTAEGFRTIFRRPLLSLAEISWRWSFWVAAWLLIVFTLFEYFDTLPVTRRDLFLLRTGQPGLVSRALAHIFEGSGLQLFLVYLFVGLALAALWIVVASLGRAATLEPLLAAIRERVRRHSSGGEATGDTATSAGEAGASRIRALAGLNFLRVLVLLVAALGCVGALFSANLVSSSKDPHPGLAFLVVMALIALVALATSSLNWFLSLAALFVGRNREDALGALSSAATLCTERPGAVTAVGLWFSLAHVTLFVMATSVVGFPLSLLPVVPTGFVLLAVLLVTAIYFAMADSLHIGRLAGYAAILEAPPAVVVAPPPVLFVPPITNDSRVETSMVDQDELILSDAAPNSQPESSAAPEALGAEPSRQPPGTES